MEIEFYSNSLDEANAELMKLKASGATTKPGTAGSAQGGSAVDVAEFNTMK
jgi:hypothetical protein